MTWVFEKELRPGQYEVVCASVPCTEYSLALTTRPRRLESADAVVQRTLTLIKFLNPTRWFIVNPRWGLLRTRPFMSQYDFLHVDYCMFNHEFGFNKPTRIWGDPSILQLSSRVCDGRCPSSVPGRTNQKSRHKERLGGNRMKATRNHKYRVPRELVHYLVRPRSPTSEVPTDCDAFAHCVLSPPTSAEPAREASEHHCIRLLRHHVWPRNAYRLNKVVTRAKHKQLVVRVQATTTNGQSRHLKLLVDTGAEANLIRPDLFILEMQPTKAPLSLVAANGQKLSGGGKEIDLELRMNIQGMSEQWTAKASFHDANIELDGILGFPWLRDNRLVIVSHQDALAWDEKEGMPLSVLQSVPAENCAQGAQGAQHGMQPRNISAVTTQPHVNVMRITHWTLFGGGDPTSVRTGDEEDDNRPVE